MVPAHDRSEKRNENRRRPRRRGFTMVEVIVVVIIIGVLALLIAPRFLGNVLRAKRNVAEANASTLKQAVRSFTLNLRTVKSGDTLRDLVWERPSDIDQDAWKQAGAPFIEKEEDLFDPWGNEYVIRIPGEKSVDFDIISYGEDGEEGGEGEAADIIK